MPTYDYECDACGHTFELFQPMSAEPEKKCPACKKKKLRRLFGTGAAIVFKGSGFYQTDYRSDSYKSSAEADKKAASDSSSSSSESNSKSSESKPADSPKSEASKPESKPSPPGKKPKE